MDSRYLRCVCTDSNQPKGSQLLVRTRPQSVLCKLCCQLLCLSGGQKGDKRNNYRQNLHSTQKKQKKTYERGLRTNVLFPKDPPLQKPSPSLSPPKPGAEQVVQEPKEEMSSYQRPELEPGNLLVISKQKTASYTANQSECQQTVSLHLIQPTEARERAW